MRTTFATAAVATAASAYDLDAMAIPDFVAGFIFGLTGDNQLTEIEQCYSGGQGIVDDAQAALSDIKAGEFIKGAEAIGKVVGEFPDALANCKNMDDDLNAIEDWAKVFLEPATLAKKVSKNWLLHGRKVKKDIAQEEADWSSSDYFDAGKDTAAAIELLVPFDSGLTYSVPVVGAVEFLGGFLQGFVGDNHLTEIATCEAAVQDESEAVLKAVKDFEAGDKAQAIMEFKDLVTNWTTALAGCAPAAMADDIQALEAWAQIFSDRAALEKTIVKHLALHRAKITRDISDVKTDWNSGLYYAGGEAAADLVTVAIGPVESAFGDDPDK